MADDDGVKTLASGLTLRRKKPIDYSESAVAANAVKTELQSSPKQLQKKKRKPEILKDRPKLVSMEGETAVTRPKPLDNTFKVIRPKFRPLISEYPSLAHRFSDYTGPIMNFAQTGLSKFDVTVNGLPCGLCSHRLPTVTELERHLTNHPEFFHTCSLCACVDQFSMEAFTDHLLTHFIREGTRLFCFFCNTKITSCFATSEAVQHLLYHCPAVPNCLICSDDLVEGTAVEHRNEVHSKLMNRIGCVACLAGFPSLMAFTNHECEITHRCICELTTSYPTREAFIEHVQSVSDTCEKPHFLLVPDATNYRNRVYFINTAAIASCLIPKSEWRHYGFLGIGRENVSLGPNYARHGQKRSLLLSKPHGSMPSSSSPSTPSTSSQFGLSRIEGSAPPFSLVRPRLRVPALASSSTSNPLLNLTPSVPRVKILRPKAPVNLPMVQTQNRTNLTPAVARLTNTSNGQVRVITPYNRGSSVPPGTLHCGPCGTTFKNIISLTEHIEHNHNNDNMLTEMVPIGAMLSICRPCRIVFESHTQFRAHTLEHRILGQVFLNCSCCSAVASTTDALDRHTTSLRYWGCMPCKLRFNHERSFFYHVAVKKHTRIFFFCKECNIGNTDIGLVVTHQRTCNGTGIGMVMLNMLRYRPVNMLSYAKLAPRLNRGYNTTICCRPSCSLFAAPNVLILKDCCDCLHNINPNMLRTMDWFLGDNILCPVVSLTLFAKAAPNDVILIPTSDHYSVPLQYVREPDFTSGMVPRTPILRHVPQRVATSVTPVRFCPPPPSQPRLQPIHDDNNDNISPQKRICLAVNAQIDAVANASRREEPIVVHID